MSSPAHCVGLKSPNGNWNSVSSTLATAMAAFRRRPRRCSAAASSTGTTIAVSHAPAATALAASMAGATKAADAEVEVPRERSHAEHPRESPGVAAQGGGAVDVARVESSILEGADRRLRVAWWRSVKPLCRPTSE